MSTVLAGPAASWPIASSAILLPTAGPFDTILGLPVHPLVVHVAVVVLPLSALGVVALFLVRRWRRGYAWLTLAGLAAGTVCAVVAKESGEQLARRVGEPADHARWGDLLPWVALPLLLVGGAWLVLAWRAAGAAPRADASHPSGAEREGRGGRSPLLTALGAVASVLAVGVLAMTVVVGHTGAQAAWGGVVTRDGTASAGSTSSASAPAATAPSGAGAGSTSGTATSGAGSAAYTMAQVTQHKTASSCWAAIGGNVYDLTSWIAQHPGGPEPIQGLCGTDGTAAFTAQHGTQRKPANELASLKIGTLAAG